MRILGIETSCDETAISLIEINEGEQKVTILGNTVHSQIDIHASYGGVFPTLAKREHGRNIIPVLEKTLSSAGSAVNGTKAPIPPEASEILSREPELLESFKAFIPRTPKPAIDLISVTIGPGLEPALWVGIGFARALSLAWNVPLVPCNHMEGHILAALIRDEDGNGNRYELVLPKFPALALLVSGGHTQIVLSEAIGAYKIAGETRDDAIGECFDKVARMLGLPYPGGPKISKLATEARKEGIESPEPLPRPMIGSDDLDFSFSGLKTAVLYLTQRIKDNKGKLDERTIKGIAREAEDAATEVIASKVRAAIERFGVETVIVGGGVIANASLRERLQKLSSETGTSLLLPQLDHSTDNGLMIALAGYFNRAKAVSADKPVKASGTLPLGPHA